jgi:hypothetical protein
LIIFRPDFVFHVEYDCLQFTEAVSALASRALDASDGVKARFRA